MKVGTTVLYLLLTLGVGVAIVAGIINIQWVHGDEWRTRGEKREADVRTDPARRGNIYSSDGKILATNVTECDLYLDLQNVVELDEYGHPKYDRKGLPIESGPITDTNFYTYLDSMCTLLAEAMPQKTVQYYRDRLTGERTKEKPRRCFLVERHVPYSVWLQICHLPGWSRGGAGCFRCRSRRGRCHADQAGPSGV
ncbi:MAG: hypothetical protein IKS44_00800, partial [Bacteroidales bacterium]|nr:hypothetical protein [Bacteroidales bacterium]